MTRASESSISESSPAAEVVPSLASGGLLARNVLLNLLGYVAPLFAALFTVPVMVKGLGVDRFGILSLTWTAITYFSLLDLGVGRAFTQQLSVALAGGRNEELPGLANVALVAMAVFGVIGGIVLAAVTPFLVERILDIPKELRAETITAFYLLCASLPFVLIATGIRSVFEAHQAFGVATALRLPQSLFNFVAPVFVLMFSHELVPIAAVLAGGRVVACAAHWIVARSRYEFLADRRLAERHVVRSLLRTGGWMSVSNVISPLMVNFDRFAVAAILPVSAVAYYSAPYDVVMKMLVIPGAVVGVLFPAFAATFETNPSATRALVGRMLRAMTLLMFPPVLLLVTFAREGMHVWLGQQFAMSSGPVVQWLAVGLLINSLGYVGFAVVQGVGRSDLAAKLHVVELPLYAAALIGMAHAFGLTGVAMAWTFRVLIDTTVLLWMSRRAVQGSSRDTWQRVTGAVALAVPLVVGASLSSASGRVVVAAVSLVAFVAFGWRRLLTDGERQWIKRVSLASSAWKTLRGGTARGATTS